MPEARVDPLSGLRTLLAPERSSRPHAWPAFAPAPELTDDDPFAEGNESMTPPEVWADRDPGSQPDSPGWRVRAVPNKYPALKPAAGEDSGEAVSDRMGLAVGMPDLLASGPAVGAHEVIINSPRPVRSLAELSLDELTVVLRAWGTRIAANRSERGYVHLCVNERTEAGATIAHTHAQLFALDFVPATVARERERMHAYFEHTQGRKLLEDLLIEEVRADERLVAIDEHAALVAPFASPSAYRLLVIPRRPEARFELAPETAAGMLHTALVALARHFDPADALAPPLNLWIRTEPPGADGYVWRIEIAPRIGQPAGFELGLGAGLNAVAPERVAAELKAVLA